MGELQCSRTDRPGVRVPADQNGEAAPSHPDGPAGAMPGAPRTNWADLPIFHRPGAMKRALRPRREDPPKGTSGQLTGPGGSIQGQGWGSWGAGASVGMGRPGAGWRSGRVSHSPQHHTGRLGSRPLATGGHWARGVLRHLQGHRSLCKHRGLPSPEQSTSSLHRPTALIDPRDPLIPSAPQAAWRLVPSASRVDRQRRV